MYTARNRMKIAHVHSELSWNIIIFFFSCTVSSTFQLVHVFPRQRKEVRSYGDQNTKLSRKTKNKTLIKMIIAVKNLKFFKHSFCLLFLRSSWII